MNRLFPFVVAALAFLLLFLWSPIALAQALGATAEDPNALTKIVTLAFEILTIVLPLFVGWLAHRGIKVAEKKTGVNVPDAIEAKIDEWIEQGIHLAAEKSYQKVKAKTEKLSGPEKLEVAVDYAWELAQNRGYIDWTKEKIRDKTEALVGIHRANGGVPSLESKAPDQG